MQTVRVRILEAVLHTMIPDGKTYSDFNLKLKRNYKLRRLQEQPPTPPQKYGQSPKLGNPLKWRRCEFCNAFYQTRLRRFRRACERRECKDALKKEWFELNKTKIKYRVDQYQHSLPPEKLQAIRKRNLEWWRERMQDPEWREHFRILKSEWREKNRGRINMLRRMNEPAKETARIRARKWYADNQDRVKEYRKSEARKKAVQKYRDKLKANPTLAAKKKAKAKEYNKKYYAANRTRLLAEEKTRRCRE